MVFRHFLENYRFLKLDKKFFEDSSPKGVFLTDYQSFRFFCLASDFRYLQSWAVNFLIRSDMRPNDICYVICCGDSFEEYKRINYTLRLLYN